MFHEAIVPLIPELVEHFTVYIILWDYRITGRLHELLDCLVRTGSIEKCWLLPDYAPSGRRADLFNHHWFIRRNIRLWRSFNFDALLASDELVSFHRYLTECVLPSDCVRVCLSVGRTHLLLKEVLSKELLSGRSPASAVALGKQAESEKQKRAIRNLVAGVKQTGSLRFLIGKLIEQVRVRVRNLLEKDTYFIDRILLPTVFAGRSFPYHAYDQLTQIGSGRSHATIFFDEVMARAHAPLFEKSRVYVASYPTRDNCRCRTMESGSSIILVLVEGYVPEEFFPLYYRDIQTVLKKTGGSAVHLRPHPRSEGDPAAKLCTYLRMQGIVATVAENDQPIREVACDYVAVVGPFSNGLFVAREACNFVNVIGLIAVSHPNVSNPRFSFGVSDHIGWIENDCSYDPDIFVRRKFVPPDRKSVPQILCELVFNQGGLPALG